MAHIYKINRKTASTLVLLLVLLLPGSVKAVYASPQVDAGEVKSSQTASSKIFSCIEGITLGQTSLEEVTGLLGESFSTKSLDDGSQWLSYDSENRMFPTIIKIIDGKVSGIWKTADESQTAFKTLKDDFGDPEESLYSFLAQNTLTYLYPSNGFFAVVNESSEAVLYLSCFAPVDLEEFLNDQRESFPTENPFTH